MSHRCREIFKCLLFIVNICHAAGTCFGDQIHCSLENDCFSVMHQCDGFWDCPLHGNDEFSCRKCSPLTSI